MTRAHEQTRLREPADRTSQVGAIDRKNLELITLDPSHPTCHVRRLSIGRGDVRIPERCEPRLPFGKFADAAKRHPGKVTVTVAACDRKEQEAHNWQRKGRC